MAVHAISHIQGSDLLDLDHLRYVAVALGTIHTPGNMPRVIELNVVGKIVDLHPLQWLLLIVALFQEFDIGSLGCDRTVTVHTSGRIRNRCMSASFYAGMTITTVYLIVAGMDLVVKRNWLIRRVANVFGGRKNQVGHCRDGNERNRKFQSFLIHS